MSDDAFITDDGREVELYYGSSVGDGMKGILINGDLISWDTNPKNGQPHHDDIDEDGARDLQLANYSSMTHDISVAGSAPPIEHASDILRMFSGYKSGDNIHISLGLRGSSIDFSFRDTVAMFKSYFKSNPPPVVEDYDDGVEDVDFLKDYEEWARTFTDSKTAQQLLGRGGRDDSFQEKDEDWSKSFSVYNNPPRNRGDFGRLGADAEFMKWFGKSKVVDKNGDPLIVYHGTSKKFKKFSLETSTQGIIWFSSDRRKIECGESGAEGCSIIMDLFVSIQNPAGWDEYGKLILGQLKSRGYDGAILRDKDGSFDGFVFDPKQLEKVKREEPEDKVGSFLCLKPSLHWR